MLVINLKVILALPFLIYGQENGSQQGKNVKYSVVDKVKTDSFIVEASFAENGVLYLHLFSKLISNEKSGSLIYEESLSGPVNIKYSIYIHKEKLDDLLSRLCIIMRGLLNSKGYENIRVTGSGRYVKDRRYVRLNIWFEGNVDDEYVKSVHQFLKNADHKADFDKINKIIFFDAKGQILKDFNPEYSKGEKDL